MKRRFIIAVFLGLGFLSNQLSAQDLMDLLGDSKETTEYTTATFKTTRLVNGQSVEHPANGVLLFLISHRFGQVNSGAYELFGLDQSTIRLGLEYGVNDRLAIGVGRSTHEKAIDGFVKYKVLRQSTGKQKMPVSLSYYGNMTVNMLKWQYPERKNYETSRYSYVNQLLLARKMNGKLSLQIMPTLVHKNLVPSKADHNDILAMGGGGRLKLTNRASVNAEYYYLLPDQSVTEYSNCLSVGFDIETGGHVFQLIFTNAKPMFERGFIAETTGKWSNGDIYFGFNISRVFTIKKPKAFKR
jgi:hypothetical protein